MTTRRSVLAASALIAATRVHPRLAIAQDATPGPDTSPAPEASALLGAWTGTQTGWNMGTIPYSGAGTITFTTAHGHIVQGAKQYTDEDGVAHEEPVEVVILSDGTILGAEHDSILFGALHEDGTLLLAKLETGLDQDAALARLRKDGQPLPPSEVDAASLKGRWIGAYDGFHHGEVTSGLCQINIAETDGQLVQGTGNYKMGDADWSVAQLYCGVLGGAGELMLSTTGGYMIGHLADDDTMDLTYLVVGMANVAVSMRLHRHETALLGTPMSEAEMPGIDLIGLWSGPRMEHDLGDVVGGIEELTITSREGAAFGGTKRWHDGDGQWFPTEALNVVVQPDGLIAMTDEDGVMLGRMLDDGSLELAYVSPGIPEPKANYNLLTRSM